MLLALMLLALAQDQDQDQDRVSTALSNYRVQTQAEIPCRTADRDDEVVVCARRAADRYRVPFVPAGSTRDSVPARTAYLTQDHSQLPCGQGPFLVNCGSVGVTVTVDGRGTHWVERERAP